MGRGRSFKLFFLSLLVGFFGGEFGTRIFRNVIKRFGVTLMRGGVNRVTLVILEGREL